MGKERHGLMYIYGDIKDEKKLSKKQLPACHVLVQDSYVSLRAEMSYYPLFE